MRGDKTVILLGFARNVPQPRQKKNKLSGYATNPEAKTKQLNRSKKLAVMKPSYNQACLDYSDTAYSEQTLWNKRLENRLQKRQRS